MRKRLTSIAAACMILMPFKAHAGCTIASYYGSEYHGGRTASGEIYNQWSMTAAHPWLPFGTRLRVTNQNNGRSVTVRINDRGPFIGGRGIDLSTAAMRQITSGGLVPVCYRRI